jgi:hypothetical protein
MLNASLNFMLPALSGAPVGALEWPAVGAVLIWLLILCVLGVSAGMLREYRRLPPATALKDRAKRPSEFRLHLFPKHFKAA